MRNESAMLGPFLDQLMALFDECYVVDHQSHDGSAQFIMARDDPRLHLFRLVSDGFPQSEVATHVAQEYFASSDADWLFFLDCDEFLPFSTGAELRGAIRRVTDGRPPGTILRLHGRNILPDRLDGSDIFAARFSSLPGLNAWAKVAAPRELFATIPGVTIGPGYQRIGGAD